MKSFVNKCNITIMNNFFSKPFGGKTQQDYGHVTEA